MKELTFQFQNIAAGLNGARYTAEGSTQFFTSLNPEAIYDDSRTNIDIMVDPLIHHDTDIISFSEVFGQRQLQALRTKLESKGYTVYYTDAFEMWSQSVQGEHLYNVIGFKNSALGPSIENHHTFRNKRKIEGLAISLKYLLSDGRGEGKRGKLEQAIHLRKRLTSGILDGAISVFEFEGFNFATGHVHRFNEEVRMTLNEYIGDNRKPFILLGDMNVSHGKKILTTPPFDTPEWKSIIHPESRTFGFVEGLTAKDRFTLATAHMQPDVLITRGLEPVDIRLIQSRSDHDGIYGRVNIIGG